MSSSPHYTVASGWALQRLLTIPEKKVIMNPEKKNSPLLQSTIASNRTNFPTSATPRAAAAAAAASALLDIRIFTCQRNQI
jgi:hypothetical protein